MTAAPDSSTWKLPRLRVDRDGVWFDDDEEVTHAGILANLRSNLRVDGEGHYLEIGPVRVPVEVADAPFVVARAEHEGERVMITLNDLSREPLVPETLTFTTDGVPHCRVKGGAFRARWSRAAAFQLLEHVEFDEAGRARLVLGTRRYPLGQVEDGPRPLG